LTYSSSPDLLKSKTMKRPVEQGNQARYTRRGLFRSLTAPVERAFESEPDTSRVNAPSSLKNAESEGAGLQRLPEARQSLVRSLRRLGQPVESHIDVKGLPFGSVSIEGECVACGLCARFCPSEALTFEEDAGNFSINFTTTACLDCTICALICPTKAVEMRHTVESNHLLVGAAETLLTGDLAKCQECGMSCAADQDEPLCFVCRWRKTIPVADIYGNHDNPSQTTNPGTN
jgi:ferredoxin